MISKNKIRFIQSLQKKKIRQEEKIFIAEGEKVVADLLKSDFDVRGLFATKEWMENTPDSILSKFDVEEISEKELGQMSALNTPNKVLALVNFKEVKVDWDSISHSYSLMLDDIRDPGNLGTIIRIADWFGIKNIICSENSVELYNPKVIQSTMGSIFRVSVFEEDIVDVLKKNKADVVIPVYGTTLEGKSIYETEFNKSGIILIGNESHGISESLFPFVDFPVSIPLYNETSRIDSLNAAVATGIICSEMKRQLSA